MNHGRWELDATAVNLSITLLLVRGDEDGRLVQALETAFLEVPGELEGLLSLTHLSGLRPTPGPAPQVLAGHLARCGASPPVRAWRLLLSALAPEGQRLAQEIAQRMSAADDESGDHFSAVLLEPALTLIAELPYSTVAPPIGRDDHDERRRTIRREVVWPSRADDFLEVVFCDGYQSTIAELRFSAVEVGWRLEICDPAPGREVLLALESHVVGADVLLEPLDPRLDPDRARWLAGEHRRVIRELRGLAEESLAHAIEWAGRELSETFISLRGVPE